MEACRLRTVVRILIAAAIAVFALERPATAQTYEVVHSFVFEDGEPLCELVEAPDGSFYGTEDRGGRYQMGSVFRLVPDGAGGFTLHEIHSFFGRDGAHPKAELILDANGWLYGTTYDLGRHGLGTIFAIDTAGHLRTVHDFAGSPDGANPQAPLILGADGFFYGTTTVGGDFDLGTVFRCDRNGNVTVVHSFAGMDGSLPIAAVTNGPLGSGSLYGTASGGVHGAGMLFRIEAGGQFTDLYDFNFVDGILPSGPLLLASDGNFYGTTFGGGSSGTGTVFRLTTSGGFSTIATLSPSDGAGPKGRLIEPSPGVLVGTSSAAGVTGSVFRVTTAGDLAVLHAFTDPEGRDPEAGLVIGSDGLFYGTTRTNGPTTNGAVYRIDLAGNYETVAPMGQPDGASCRAGLFQASDGLLYGTCSVGGSSLGGTIYAIGSEDAYEVVHDFVTGIGTYPVAGVSEGADLALYGSTDESIFRLDPATHDFSTLHTLSDADGKHPYGDLRPRAGGFLYGTAYAGGSQDKGTLFRIDTGGTFEKLWDFMGPEGNEPQATLTEGSDGNVYGTTFLGGSAQGAIYRFGDLTGATLVHGLAQAEGQNPVAGLLETTPGVFFGTTTSGGANDLGTLFQVTSAGDLTVLHDFGADTDGASPYSGLLLASDGNFYGTTFDGGLYGKGTVYRLDSEGTLTLAHEFTTSEGTNPFSALIEATDGNLYGTTYFGGAAPNSGTVYRLVFPGGDAPIVESIAPASGPAAGGASLVVTGQHFSAFPMVAVGTYSSSAIGVDSRTVLFVAPPLDPGTLNDVTIKNPDQQTATLVAALFADFLDVPYFHSFHDFVESIFRAGITAGCGGGNFCVDSPVTREQMAVFLLKAEHGGDYLPPPCTGVFTDVSCTPGVGFPDWIEQLYAEHVTGGCVADPLQYCPGRAVTRAEMAVFLLKTKHGSGYVPNSCAGIFADVPCPATPEFPFSDWIEQLYADAITGGCATDPLRYCPDNPNLRGEMAVFLTKTFLPYRSATRNLTAPEGAGFGDNASFNREANSWAGPGFWAPRWGSSSR